MRSMRSDLQCRPWLSAVCLRWFSLKFWPCSDTLWILDDFGSAIDLAIFKHVSWVSSPDFGPKNESILHWGKPLRQGRLHLAVTVKVEIVGHQPRYWTPSSGDVPLMCSWFVVFRPTPLKNDGVSNSSNYDDYDIPKNYMESHFKVISKPCSKATRNRMGHL